MGSEIDRAADLLTGLYEDGHVSEEAITALLETDDAPRQIGSGLGTHATGRELLLATILIDDSPSIRPNVSYVRRGHALMLAALRKQATTTDVLVLTKAFNRGVLSPYRPLGEAWR